jgi:hypothetical protein
MAAKSEELLRIHVLGHGTTSSLLDDNNQSSNL